MGGTEKPLSRKHLSRHSGYMYVNLFLKSFKVLINLKFLNSVVDMFVMSTPNTRIPSLDCLSLKVGNSNLCK